MRFISPIPGYFSNSILLHSNHASFIWQILLPEYVVCPSISSIYVASSGTSSEPVEHPRICEAEGIYVVLLFLLKQISTLRNSVHSHLSMTAPSICRSPCLLTFSHWRLIRDVQSRSVLHSIFTGHRHRCKVNLYSL